MRFTKIIALTLASAITLTTLTSCASDSGGGIFEASVTQVEDKPYNMDGIEGTYTGDWKSGCPNGNGTLIVDDYEFYSGEWSDGMLVGHGEMRKAYDDGTWRYYNGECLFNQPFGQGQLFTGIIDDPYTIEVDGDFSDESTLLYFVTNENGKLVDIGNIQNGGYVTFINNSNARGMDFLEDGDQLGYDTIVKPEYTAQYFGQVDENNIPNGYGYYVTYTEAYNEFQETNNTDMHTKLGTWKDGHIDGYYTSLHIKSSFKPNSGTIYNAVKEEGCLKNRVNVGDYVQNSSHTDYDGSSSYSIIKMNKDTSDTFELYDDGIYRTSYITNEYYNSDGTYGYNKYRRWVTDPDDWFTGTRYEGEYTNYDANGNIIDYGQPKANLSELEWESTKPRSLMDDLIVIGGVLLAGYAIYKVFSWSPEDPSFKNSAAGQLLENTRESVARELEQRDLREEAKDEVKNGHYEKAKELLREAESLYWP